MADNWYEYAQGSPEQRLADLEYQRKQLDAAKRSPEYQMLRRLSRSDQADLDYDPREAMMMVATPDRGIVADNLYPRRTSDGAEDVEGAVDYVTMMGTRLRDTALRSAQEAAAGNYGDAAMLALRAPLAAGYPPAAAGTPDSPDDWRAQARKNGLSETQIAMFDWGTDPEMWISAPIAGPAAYAVPALPFAAARLGRRMAPQADDALRAVGRAFDTAMHGPGARTELIDEAGEAIRRLKNSPRIGVEYGR